MDNVYCYANPDNFVWGDNTYGSFKPDKGTLFHVYNKEEWENVFPKANVTFVGDLTEEGEEGTGIHVTILGETVCKNVYDLSGKRMDNPSKGIYIIGGKKVILK